MGNRSSGLRPGAEVLDFDVSATGFQTAGINELGAACQTVRVPAPDAGAGAA